MTETLGHRCPDGTEFHEMAPGDYALTNGRWVCRAPSNANGDDYFGDLTNHQVIEHEDGTISVTPSILITKGVRADRECWHGYLTRGVWTGA